MATVRKDDQPMFEVPPFGTGEPGVVTDFADRRPRARGTGVAWHAMSIEEVLQRLSTDETDGLTATEAEQRLEQYGANRVQVRTARGDSVPWWRSISWGMPHWPRHNR